MKTNRIDQEGMTAHEQAAWRKIESSFRSAKSVKPSKGFADRWILLERKDSLAEKKRREAWLAFGNGTAILAILCVMVFTLWPEISLPGTVFASVLQSLLDALTFIVISIGVGLSIFRSLSPIAWLGVAAAFFGLLALWTAIFSRLVVSAETRTLAE